MRRGLHQPQSAAQQQAEQHRGHEQPLDLIGQPQAPGHGVESEAFFDDKLVIEVERQIDEVFSNRQTGEEQ